MRLFDHWLIDSVLEFGFLVRRSLRLITERFDDLVLLMVIVVIIGLESLVLACGFMKELDYCG